MNWTEFLKQEIETNYKATLGLIDKVDDNNLAWKPETGANWMTMWATFEAHYRRLRIRV